MSIRTALYRLYSAAGDLLYIGVTGNPEARFASHASTKPWWPEVARHEIAWFATRELAELAEDEAILTEHARYNVAGSPWASKPRELGEREMTVGQAAARLASVARDVRITRRPVFIVDRKRARSPVAAVVTVELADAMEAAGGPDAAIEILREAAK